MDREERGEIELAVSPSELEWHADWVWVSAAAPCLEKNGQFERLRQTLGVHNEEC
jgi:hypothetical protein